MDTRYHFVNDMQKEGLIDVNFVPTKKNVADVATKNVTAEVMESHNDLITAERDYWKNEELSSSHWVSKLAIVKEKSYGSGRVLRIE